MRARLLLAALLMAPLVARAQSYPQWQEGYVPGIAVTTTRPIPTANCVPANTNAAPACGSWLDWLNAKQDYGTVFVVPDVYHQAADGADDAPAILRAQSTGLPLLFKCRHYAINSAISVTSLANWRGCGWQSQPVSIATAAGTWFDIGPAFVASAAAPITISGNATGSVIEGFAVDEPGMTPAPAAVTNSSGQITAWSPASWTPAAYTEVFRVSGAPDVTFRHLFFAGVNAGISQSGSGRSHTEDIRGQAFSYLISVQESYDVSRIIDVHEWPFWSQADPVLQYQQAHTQAIISDRNDTPFWDRIFAFGVLDGVAIMSNTDGSTSGAAIGTLSCDFTQYCLHVYAGSLGVGAHIASIRTYGQAWNTVYGAAVTMLPNSTMLQMDGSAVLQIGQANSYGTDKAAFAFTNGVNPSNVHVDSFYVQLGYMSANAMVAMFPTASGSLASLLTINQPVLTANAPSGFTATNNGATPAGIGTYQTASYVTQH